MGSSESVQCSVVIPVYNSEGSVGEVVDRTVRVFEETGRTYQIVLVNDGSTDGSWEVIEQKARENPSVVAVDFLKNYGQHTAVFAAMRMTTGDYVITLDDDLQNPPEEIPVILEKAEEGYDLVLGQFRRKKSPLYRRMGTRVIDWMNRKVFGKPKDLILSNFRCIRRDVIDRIGDYRGSHPYIPGLALMYSRRPVNVLVEHRPRTIGTSGYGFRKILELVFRILFNYSSFPLRFVSMLGLAATGVALTMATVIFLRALIVGTTVPGWASVAVMLAFFNGLMLLIISMLGEYVVRMLDQMSQIESYHIREIVGDDG
ncbi:MAG: glycosyltransferase family 2 protein [Actinobacteria bacterium]|nr:glycosyltransferase family 2 protein [Actinomycetota bacterium]